MIRLSFCKFLSHSRHLHEKGGILSRSIATSYVSQNKILKKSNVNAIKREYFEEDKKNYEDTFGNLESFELKFQRIKDDPEDILEYERGKLAQNKSILEYGKEIKAHLENHDYESALKVLEVDMVNDKKRVNIYTYKILINYNAKIGNLKEAYRLFINFKKRQGVPTAGMYTSMFNACANCKNSFLAIEKANSLEQCMRKNQRHRINISNYNVMLKAYGRHADLSSCLRIMDEVLGMRNKVRADTYNFLLQACLSDKNSGLRHALILWRKMIQSLVKPDIWCFETILRCVKECSLGDALLVSNLIKDIEQETKMFFKRKVEVRTLPSGEKIRKAFKIPASENHFITEVNDKPQITDGKNERDFIQIDGIECTPLALEGEKETSSNLEKENEVKDLELSTNENKLCESSENASESVMRDSELSSTNDVNISLKDSDFLNLIALKPSTGAVINFGVLREPHHRFLLLGGVKGFLKTMREFGVQPNLKVFTLMLNVIPSTLRAEEELISIIESYEGKLDTAFFNCLIKRRFFRFEDSAVKDSLEKMYSLNLKPDLITFGTLALGCRTCELGKDLIRTLHIFGYRANTEILETLLNSAIRAKDMNYILTIIRTAKEDETQLSKSFIASLSMFVQKELKKRDEEVDNALKEFSSIPESTQKIRLKK